MSATTMGLAAQYVDITGSAKPHSFEDRGFENEVAGILITSQFDGSGVLIEGRPDDLITQAREILRVAELINAQTLADPDLRRLYGE